MTTKHSGKVFQNGRPKGRPRVIPPEREAMIRNLCNDPQGTLRSVHNFHYLVVAMKAMTPNAARWPWLFTKPGQMVRRRSTIVSQLGRVADRDPQVMEVFADRLCVLKPTAHEAVTMLRGWWARWESVIAIHIALRREVDVVGIAEKVCQSD